jgi:hypothetical protein
MNFELKKSLSILELGDLVQIVEMQEKDITLVDLSYEDRLELLLETLIQDACTDIKCPVADGIA